MPNDAVVLPTGESELKHIFREALGHVLDSPENRVLLLEVANDPAAGLPADRYGNEWSARILSDGRQVWTQVRNRKLVNGGINDQPRQLQPEYRTEIPMREIVAYKAMVQFLEDRYERTPSDALGGLLGELEILPDGTPADPAVSADWERVLATIDAEEVSAPGVVPMRRTG